MGRIGILFAGQGSQYAGMGQEIYHLSDKARDFLDRVEKVRAGTLSQCFYDKNCELNRTINTQPCLYAINLACYYALAEKGIVADYMAGFSLGELSAIAACGMIDDIDGLCLTIKRAEFMEECANSGGMYAIIGLDAEQVEKTISEYEGVYCANYNTDTQTVISGTDNLEQAVVSLKNIKGRCIKLNVNGAFHSKHMLQASINFKKYLETVKFMDMKIPLYSNYTGEIYEQPYQEKIAQQINNPVKWTTIIRNMQSNGVTTFIEVGPKEVLSNLVKKIAPSCITYNVMDKASLTATLNNLNINMSL